MSKSDQIRLRHMLDAAVKATAAIQGKTREDLDSDEILSMALARFLEILGEAAKTVSEDTRQKAPTIPWNQIA